MTLTPHTTNAPGTAPAPITLDGSQGEGGGQILRSALALSLITGRAFRIHRIRAGRSKPGLMRQHLACVEAAVRIGTATAEGATLGSQELTFSPGPIVTGTHEFQIASSGSTMLLLQSILPPLLLARQPSELAELSLLGTLKVKNPSKSEVLRSKVCTTSGSATGRLVGS
jgi:RNA 3'-phosphate cyclase